MTRSRVSIVVLIVMIGLACSTGQAFQAPAPSVPGGDIMITFDPNGPFDNAGIKKGTGPTAPPIEEPPPIPEGGGPEGGSAPQNDTCLNGTIIPGNVVTYNPALLNTTGATTSPCEGGENCEAGGVGISNSVWYSYTPVLSGYVEINTFGSNYNTVLSVWPGCPGGVPPLCVAPTQIACNDDALFGTTSQVFINVIAGHTYRIKVSDYNTTDGGGLLNFNLIWHPPNDQCSNATVIPGVVFDPPTYSTVNTDTETCEAQESCEVNNVGVSNTVWYSFTAPCDGLININTNGSSYDTVLSVWDKCGFFYAVDFPCNYGDTAPDELACDDDSGTGTNSQLMNVPVVGGLTYLIKVSDYDTSAGGGTLNFNFAFIGADPPVAEITMPTALSCVCGTVDVQGTASAGGAPITRTLEYQAVGASSWTLISTSTAEVTNGSLGNWITAALSQNYYVLRLTVQNSCGLVSTAVAVVFVDAGFDTLDVRAPHSGDIVGGTTCVDGTVWDHCFASYTVMYRPSGGGAFTPVDAGNPVYNTTAVNDPLAGPGWNTTALPDGNYELRVAASDQCAHNVNVVRTVTVDNTAPIALISAPTSCGSVSSTVAIMGTANDTHLLGWTLQYTGGNVHNWVTIASGASPVINGFLGNWSTAGLPPCAYTLRLIVTDGTVLNCGPLHSQTEYTLAVSVGSPSSCCDVNHDGASNGLDVAPFVTCLLNGICP